MPENKIKVNTCLAPCAPESSRAVHLLQAEKLVQGKSVEIGWTSLTRVGVQQSAVQEGNQSFGKISYSLELRHTHPELRILLSALVNITPFTHVFTVHT